MADIPTRYDEAEWRAWLAARQLRLDLRDPDTGEVIATWTEYGIVQWHPIRWDRRPTAAETPPGAPSRSAE
jgi:hypothetical protein